MKKIVAYLLSFLLILGISSAGFADGDSKDFDLSVLEKSELYSYDSFEKAWLFNGIYGIYYQSGVRSLFNNPYFMMIAHMDSKHDSPAIRFISFPDPDKDESMPITSFQAVVDDTLYSFEPLCALSMDGFKYGMIEAGNIAREFLNSLSGADKIAFKYTREDNLGKSTTWKIEPVDKEELKEVIEAARLLEESNAWSICSDLGENDKYYGASMQEW